MSRFKNWWHYWFVDDHDHRWEYAQKVMQEFANRTGVEVHLEHGGSHAHCDITIDNSETHHLNLALVDDLEAMRDAAIRDLTYVLFAIMKHRLGTDRFIRTRAQRRYR